MNTFGYFVRPGDQYVLHDLVHREQPLPFHGILIDWPQDDTVVDLVLAPAPPPRFPWEIPVAVALIVAGLAFLLLG